MLFVFSSRRRHTRCALVTGVRRVLFRSHMPDRYLCLKILAAAIDAEICRRQRPAPVAARVAPTLASHGQRPVAALTRHVWHLPNPAQAARRRFALAHAAWPVRPAGFAFHAKRLNGPAFPATPDEHHPPADEKNLASRRRRRSFPLDRK